MFVPSDCSSLAHRHAAVAASSLQPMQALSPRACFVIVLAFLAGLSAQTRYTQRHQKRTVLRGDTFDDGNAHGQGCASFVCDRCMRVRKMQRISEEASLPMLWDQAAHHAMQVALQVPVQRHQQCVCRRSADGFIPVPGGLR